MAIPLISLLAMALLSSSALADEADPTRPPAAYLVNSSQVGGTPVEAVPPGRLTSIVLPKRGGGQARAVIDGQLVRRGEKVGDSTLVRISETEVLLEGPGGKETLYLTPAVTKKPVTGKAMRPSKKESP